MKSSFNYPPPTRLTRLRGYIFYNGRVVMIGIVQQKKNHQYQSVIKTKYLKMYITFKMKDMFTNSMSIKKISPK